MKLLFDESLSPKLVLLLTDLFPESESALLNGLARVGDRSILDYALAHDFVLVSTDKAISSVCTSRSPGPTSSFSGLATIQLMLRQKCFDAMRSVSPRCPTPKAI